MALNRREQEKRRLRYNSAKERAEKHERKFEPTALNVPDGVELFRFTKAKTYKLDILPYIASKGNHYCDEGLMHYERTYFVHSIPTPDGRRSYCCLAKTFRRKACPICEELSKAERSGKVDQATLEGMVAKERQLFNVIDLDEKEKGVQIFEFNFWEFGRHLDAKVRAKDKYEGFYHLEGGRTVEVTTSEGKFMGITRYKPDNIEFEEREDYAESMLDKTICLDELPKELPYDELRRIFVEGTADGPGEAEEEKPRSRVSTRTTEENGEDEEEELVSSKRGKETTAEEFGLEEGDEVEYNGVTYEITKVSGDGTSLTLTSDSGKKVSGIDPEDVEKIDVEEEDEELDQEERTPVKKPAKTSSRHKSTEDEDEDDLDQDDLDDNEPEEDEPVARKGKKSRR